MPVELAALLLRWIPCLLPYGGVPPSARAGCCTDNPKTAIRYVSGAFLSGNRQGKKIWMVFVRKQHNKRATFGHSHQKLARECSFRPPPPLLGRASTESGIVKPVSGPRTPGSGAYASEAVRYDVLIRSITSQFSSSIIL